MEIYLLLIFQSGLRDFNLKGGKFAMSCVMEYMFGEF
jgi:hypothetical protein